MSVASPIFARHGHSLQSGEALAPAAQGAALFMTLVVAGILLAIALGIFILVRRTRQGETPERALLREVREDSKREGEPRNQSPTETAPEPESPPTGWEKDPGWWKDNPNPGNNSPD